MANKNSGVVDISSSSQVYRVYNKKGKALRIIALVLSIVLLLSGGGLLYYYSVLNSLNFKDISSFVVHKEPDATTPGTDAEPINGKSQLTIGSGQLLQDSKVLNVMLFGEDNNQGEKYGRTDTMIMMSIDNRHKKIKLTSFQRDSYVYIPGFGYDKINAAYTFGGPKLTIETIEANFGIKIDRYAVVDFNSFIDIIDTLGGIEIEVTADEIEYINYQMYKNKQSSEWSTIKEQPGVIKLTGQEALWYARNRGLTKGEDGNEIGIDGDDWDRTLRQRKFLQTMIESMKSASLPEIIQIVSTVGPKITTNLKKDEITSLVSHALTYLSYEVVQFYVPSEGLWYYDNDTPVGSAIIIADMDAQRLALAEFIYEDAITGVPSSSSAAATTATEKKNN